MRWEAFYVERCFFILSEASSGFLLCETGRAGTTCLLGCPRSGTSAGVSGTKTPPALGDRQTSAAGRERGAGRRRLRRDPHRRPQHILARRLSSRPDPLLLSFDEGRRPRQLLSLLHSPKRRRRLRPGSLRRTVFPDAAGKGRKGLLLRAVSHPVHIACHDFEGGRGRR